MKGLKSGSGVGGDEGNALEGEVSASLSSEVEWGGVEGVRRV